MFIKNKAKVESRVGCSQRGVMYFRQLLFKSNKKKFGFRKVVSYRRRVLPDEQKAFNPLNGTLKVKPQSNGPLCSNTMIGKLAVDGWAVIFGTTMRGLGVVRPSSLYQILM